jgi:hypothetical protein
LTPCPSAGAYGSAIRVAGFEELDELRIVHRAAEQEQFIDAAAQLAVLKIPVADSRRAEARGMGDAC